MASTKVKRNASELETNDNYTSDSVSDHSEEHEYDDLLDKISPELQEFAARAYQLVQEDKSAPLFLRNIYSSSSCITQHLADASVIFAGRLLHHLVTMDIPTASGIKVVSLPVQSGFGVHILILQKDSHVLHKMYCGSGTHDGHGGFCSRLATYDYQSTVLPFEVAAAIKDGYEIIQKNAVAWCSTPQGTVYHDRMLFLVLRMHFRVLPALFLKL